MDGGKAFAEAVEEVGVEKRCRVEAGLGEATAVLLTGSDLGDEVSFKGSRGGLGKLGQAESRDP